MNERRTIAVVTGSRAEFGLLEPVMRAIDAHEALELLVFVTGTHLLPPARTIEEMRAALDIAAVVEMQRPGEVGRLADAAALGRGISGFAEQFARRPLDVVLVLGDRIEAFAAAAAASVAGIHLAHMHGGDRAEGIADEAIRHAITKLAHIHLPATARSAERIIAMGEEPLRTHLVGSPAIDGLAAIGPLDDETYDVLGRPEIVFLLHPDGDDDDDERTNAARLLALCASHGRVLALHPNHDPGRDGIVEAIEAAAERGEIVARPHLPRDLFVGLLRQARMIVGNSSAGLIECAAIGLRCINVGPRQAGREKPSHVVNCPSWDATLLRAAFDQARYDLPGPVKHPYGDGRAGLRTAEVLATFQADNHGLVKQNSY